MSHFSKKKDFKFMQKSEKSRGNPEKMALPTDR